MATASDSDKLREFLQAKIAKRKKQIHPYRKATNEANRLTQDVLRFVYNHMKDNEEKYVLSSEIKNETLNPYGETVLHQVIDLLAGRGLIDQSNQRDVSAQGQFLTYENPDYDINIQYPGLTTIEDITGLWPYYESMCVDQMLYLRMSISRTGR